MERLQGQFIAVVSAAQRRWPEVAAQAEAAAIAAYSSTTQVAAALKDEYNALPDADKQIIIILAAGIVFTLCAVLCVVRSCCCRGSTAKAEAATAKQHSAGHPAAKRAATSKHFRRQSGSDTDLDELRSVCSGQSTPLRPLGQALRETREGNDESDSVSERSCSVAGETDSSSAQLTCQQLHAGWRHLATERSSGVALPSQRTDQTATGASAAARTQPSQQLNPVIAQLLEAMARGEAAREAEFRDRLRAQEVAHAVALRAAAAAAPAPPPLQAAAEEEFVALRERVHTLVAQNRDLRRQNADAVRARDSAQAHARDVCDLALRAAAGAQTAAAQRPAAASPPGSQPPSPRAHAAAARRA
ncbi:hypothetical protein JKP88DRAFT_276411 [Tribonema minus]|uniref:Uncharacterized protein n=1 Tax=Tribonema minus TaxID=303371 RepID=A0A835ZBV0_9STRA|nr:hypothetical protein JKP88DRAFT_276411 [Tribonema minus]